MIDPYDDVDGAKPPAGWVPKGGMVSETSCPKCGMECKTKLALSKHEPKCEFLYDHERFTNRFDGGQRCPKCSQYGKSFYKLSVETWVCLECGMHFTPGVVLDGLRREVMGIKWARPSEA